MVDGYKWLMVIMAIWSEVKLSRGAIRVCREIFSNANGVLSASPAPNKLEVNNTERFIVKSNVFKGELHAAYMCARTLCVDNIGACVPGRSYVSDNITRRDFMLQLALNQRRMTCTGRVQCKQNICQVPEVQDGGLPKHEVRDIEPEPTY